MLFITVFLLPWLGSAQDIHFSQFYNSPLTLNPAATGNYDGNWRVMNNFRSQWAAVSAPYTTISLGYDHQFYLPNEKDKISAGLIFVNDKSGDLTLTSNKILVSLAFHKKVNKQTVSFGLQGGFITKAYSTANLSLPDQWIFKQGFDSNAPTSDTKIGQQASFMDINFGAQWKTTMDKLEPTVGIALFHLNSPNETFMGNDNKLPLRMAFNAGAKYHLSDKYFLYPNLLFHQDKKVNEMVIGTHFGINLPKNNAEIKYVMFGPYFRGNRFVSSADAIVIALGANIYDFDVGISYDINVSGLKTATQNRGGIEFSIIYTKLRVILEKITLPCDRM